MKIEMIGRRFGRLIVTQEAVERTKLGELRYLCTCDCGNKVIVRGNRLRSGVTRSCGCLAKEVAAEQMRKRHSKRFR